jgi:hypothetical protein
MAGEEGKVPKTSAIPLKSKKPGQIAVPDIEVGLGMAGPAGDVKPPPPSFAQKAGLQLAWSVGGLIAVCTILLLLEWSFHAPSTLSSDDLKGTAKTLAENFDNAKKMIDNQKVLSEIYTDRSIKFFDAIVGKALLPVFTTIIGYIIGTRAGREA